jgi:hypothetical protein
VAPASEDKGGSVRYRIQTNGVRFLVERETPFRWVPLDEDGADCDKIMGRWWSVEYYLTEDGAVEAMTRLHGTRAIRVRGWRTV